MNTARGTCFAILCRVWALVLVLSAASLFAIASASAQGALSETVMDEFGDLPSNETVVELPAGGSHVWTFSADAGTVVTTLEPRDAEVTFATSRDGSPIDSFVSDGASQHQSGYYTATATTWEITVTAPVGRAVSYKLSWFQDHMAGDAGQSLDDDAWNGTMDTWDETQSGQQPGGAFSMFDDINPVGLLDTILAFLARTVFPYLALLAVQSITVFFVLALMMRPSSKSAASETLPELDTAQPTSRAAALTFHEVSHIDEVARDQGARRRLQRLKRNNAFTRWWFLVTLAVFAPLSLVALGPGAVPLIQLAIGVALWILFATIGRPLGIRFALLTLVLMLTPLGVFFVQKWIGPEPLLRGVAAVGALLVGLAIIIALSRRRAAKTGKQDLLVLRVFGMDKSARETFSTIARAWSYLGASATIADPSYVRFQFTGMRGNAWKMLLVALATILAIIASVFPAVQALFPPGLSEVRRAMLLTIAAFVVLIPFVVIPVFLSVRQNFIKDIDRLLATISRIMGPKLRADGYYPRRAFFCHDDLWRPAVHKMMQEAEVLLLDFRGFDAANLGCAYEIGKVLDTVDLDRAVLVIDSATDAGVLYGIFNSCWSKLSAASPNAANAAPVLKVFIAHESITLKNGVWTWFVSYLLLRRWRRWRQDSRGILGLLATARRDTAGAA